MTARVCARYGAQLESLIRLSEARARMDLRPEVTREDALDAVAVVQETIAFDTLTDLCGGTEQLGGGGGGGGGGLSFFGGNSNGNGNGAGAGGGQPRPSAMTSKKASHRGVCNDFIAHLEHRERERESPLWTRLELRDEFRLSRLQVGG